MEELQDYSGEFRPDLTLQDLSKEFLERLLRAAAKLYVGLDGIYYGLIREKFGEETARELSAEAWLKRGGVELEVRRVKEAANIQGDDVANVFKHFQVDPGGQGDIWPEVEYDLKDRNHGTLTVKRCRSLEYFERHGDTELMKHACEVLDGEGIPMTARLFNSKIKCRPLKMPPRKSKDEVACIWEFVLED